MIHSFEDMDNFANYDKHHGHVMFYLYNHYINTNELPNYFTLIMFGVKGVIYYVAHNSNKT